MNLTEEEIKKRREIIRNVKENVLKNVEKTYYKQKEKGVVRRAHYNYSLLEKSMQTWEKLHNL